MSDEFEDLGSGESGPGAEAVKAAFGAENRARLIDAYFDGIPEAEIDAANAWRHVYRLLLWVDPTTGLGHCYESDKCQPGKPWYARSLAFHDWVSEALGVNPPDLGKAIDWLFLRASDELATFVLMRLEKHASKAAAQRQPYEGRGFPIPGEDPELVGIIRGVLGSHLASDPPAEVWADLTIRLRQYLMQENKRKNLVGEGFEDVLAQVIRRVVKRDGLEVHSRRLLHDLPGFSRAREGEKPNKVDVSVLRPGMRTLVTAKWSVRADREKQFTTDFADYVAARADSKPFEYVFVTNEFDPARLMRACEILATNAPMFNHVVHINTEALRAAYLEVEGGPKDTPTIRKVRGFIDEGRLIGLGDWLNGLAAPR